MNERLMRHFLIWAGSAPEVAGALAVLRVLAWVLLVALLVRVLL